MRLCLIASVFTILSLPIDALHADDAKARAIVEQGLKALGGEGKLTKAAGFYWEVEGAVLANEQVTGRVTIQGVDWGRLETEYKRPPRRSTMILAGDKGWQVSDGAITKVKEEDIAHEKWVLYLQVIPVTLLPLKTKAFQIETVSSEQVAGGEQVGLKVTGPDGKDFRLYFDKKCHLPSRLLMDLQGPSADETEEVTFTQEITFEEYREFDGIQKATHIEFKRDGQKLVEFKVTKFKVLSKIEEGTFAEPK